MTNKDQVNYSDAVLNLQKYLRRISYSDPRIPRVATDGIYGSDTARAVGEFQRIASLPVTEIADRRTFDAIYSEYKRLTGGDTGELILAIPKRNYLLSRDDRSSMVSLLQILLGEISPIYDSSLTLSPTGIFDEATERAVRAMQRAFGLEETGRTDPLFWQYLAEAYSLYIDSFE